MRLGRRTLPALLALAFIGSNITVASAPQPVNLTSANSSADKGPILVDGKVSFVIRANFTKPNQTQGFRAALKADETLYFEYLIIDKAGKKTVIKFTERTKFYYPFLNTNFLYLARYDQPAIDGVYKFTLQSKTKAAIQVVVGTLETYGEVLTPATCPAWVKPLGEIKILPAYAEGLVGMKKDAAAACAEKLGWQYRIGEEDDQMFALTRDYRLDRITVSIKNGLITQSLVG